MEGALKAPSWPQKTAEPLRGSKQTSEGVNPALIYRASWTKNK
jgi:hypothetical protein